MTRFEYDGMDFNNDELGLYLMIKKLNDENGIDITKKQHNGDASSCSYQFGNMKEGVDIDRLIGILKKRGILVRRCPADTSDPMSLLLSSITRLPDYYLTKSKNCADNDLLSFAKAIWSCGVAALKLLPPRCGSTMCLESFSDLKRLVSTLDDQLKEGKDFQKACCISIGWMTAERCYRFCHGADTLDSSEIDLYIKKMKAFKDTLNDSESLTNEKLYRALQQAKELTVEKVQEKLEQEFNRVYQAFMRTIKDDCKFKETLSDSSSKETTVQIADTSCRSQASELIENFRLQMKKNELDSQKMKAKLREIYEACSSDEDLESFYSIEGINIKKGDGGDSDLKKLKVTLRDDLKTRRLSAITKYIDGYRVYSEHMPSHNKWDLDNLGIDEWKELSRLCFDSFKYARLLELASHFEPHKDNVVVRFYNITRHFSLELSKGTDAEIVWNYLNEDERIPFYSHILAKKELYMGKLTLEELFEMDNVNRFLKSKKAFYSSPWLKSEARHGGNTRRNAFKKDKDPERLSKTLFQGAIRSLKTEEEDIEVKLETLSMTDSPTRFGKT